MALPVRGDVIINIDGLFLPVQIKPDGVLALIVDLLGDEKTFDPAGLSADQ